MGISKRKAQGSPALALRANCQILISTEHWQKPLRNTAGIPVLGCEDDANTNRHRWTDRCTQTQRISHQGTQTPTETSRRRYTHTPADTGTHRGRAHRYAHMHRKTQQHTLTHSHILTHIVMQKYMSR